MKVQPLSRTIAAAALTAALAACGSAPQAGNQVAPAPTRSVEQADQRLAAVAAARAAIEARFAERERACYEKFFVNHCLDDAKERRRSALAAQRAIEVEAEHFKRQAKVEERDRAIAEAEAQYKAEEARLANEPPPAPRALSKAPPPRPAPVAERLARQKARTSAAEARDQADAAKRAANVAAFNKRKAESEERQREVAERKAAKAAKDAQQQQAAPAAPPTPGQ
jgi:colicin import membrane protein